MSLTSQTSELKGSEMTNQKLMRNKFYTLRKRFKNDNLIQLPHKKTKLRILCELLCKPVSVNITKLSISEIKKWCKKNSYIAGVKNELIQKKELTYKKNRTKKDTKTTKSEHQFPHLNNFENKEKREVLLHKKTKIENKKLLVKDILKDVKQPYIKLHRIDEVINKIAQSFAKTTPIKECETSAQTECMKESDRTELNVSTPEQLKLSALNFNRNEYLENHETEPIVTKSPTNEIQQSNKYVNNDNDISDCDSDFELSVKISKKCLKRAHIFDDSDDDIQYDNANNNSHEIRLDAAKRLRINLLEKTVKISKINQDHSSTELQDIDDSQKLQVESSTELNVSNELCNSSDKKDCNINKYESVLQQKPSIPENIPIMNNYDNDDIDKNSKEGNTSNCVSSELNFVCSIKDNICTNDNSVTIEEPISENRNIQESIQKSFISDKDLIQKYNLFKELKVILIKFDSLKNFNNEYSATKIEQIMDIYINSLTNFNFSKVQVHKKSLDEISSTSSSLNDNFEEHVQSTDYDLNTKIFETPNKNAIHLVAGETQNMIEPISILLKKSSQNVIKHVNLQQKEISKTQKACHNLTEHFEDNSEKRSKQNISDLEQKSIASTVVTKCTLLSSSQKSTKKIPSILSNINGNTIDIEKSANTSHIRSAIESINEMSSLNKEIESSLHKKDSTALITNVKSPEKMKINTLNIISLKPYSSNENEKLLASGIKTFVSKALKRTTNITHSKKATKKSASTCYSSIISPAKHKKLMDKKDSRHTTYKCIVCDLCFEDYSDLQPHLITHTQKQSNTLLCSPKDVNESSDKSEETILCSSEVKASLGPSQILEQNSIEYSSPSKTVTDEGNRQDKKRDISKRLLNKEKKKKRIQSVSNSNECSICLKVFPTKPDLAAHIYLHTERELQEAYKLAKQKLNESGNSTVDNTIQINEKTQKVSDKEELLHTQKLNKSLIAKDSEIQDKESNTVNENDLQSTELCLSLRSDKEKTNKVESSKKSFTICECHNKPGTNENCLQIEIVLLCHTCRILFRSMECFENHYRLPEHGKCNQNRFSSGRSPNLFCATCGMIFSSVQDVRHHLEIHARFKKNCRIDFRCNICKVIFLGIGTLFYIHWTKHARDPFWVANELSFPKYSIINAKLRKIDNLSTHNAITSNTSMEEYIQVAENVCYNCKLPFVTTDDLKKHVQRCNGIKSDQDVAATVENSSTKIQSHLTIKITCSLCNDTFTKRTEFYKHIKDKHNCNSDPQFVCISFTAAKVVFICSICMAIAENLDDFENHWLKHNITHVCFVCSQCSKTYRNNLNSFIEHGKEHKTESDVLNCIVNYEKTKFVCNFCNIGFDSSKSMREHNIIHKLNNQQTNSKSDEVINIASSASETEIDRVSSSIETKELSIEKQLVESLHIEDHVTEKINEASLARSNTDSDKEKLIKILEGSEDDSEHELIIDLTKHSEECNEPLRGEENREKQTSFNIKLNASSTTQTCVISKNDIANTLEKDIDIQSLPQNDAISENSQNIMPVATSSFTSKNIIPLVSSQDTNLNPQISNSNIKLTNVSQNSHVFRNNVSNNNLLEIETKSKSDKSVMENVESIQNKVHDTDSIINQEESSISRVLPSVKKQSSLKPKSGFLRVKTLAELCGCTVEDTDNLVEHPKSDDTLIKNGKKYKIIGKELFPKLSIDSIPRLCKFGEPSSYEKPIPSHSNTLPLSSSNVVYRKLLPKIQSTTNIINSQQSQQLQTNTTQNKHSSSPQIITSAYHKNLPACNIVRTTTAIPRSAILKNDVTSVKVVANTANISNAQKAQIASCSINENKQLSSFINVMNLNDPYKYKCKFCNFRSNDIAECLMHNLPGTSTQCGHSNQSGWNNQRLDNENLQTVTTTNILPNNQNHKQYQQTIMNQSGIKCASSPICYQYPYLAAGSSNSNNNTEVLKQNQQIIANQQVAGSASSSIYYKNPNHSTGGMSIVINQTAPPVQNIPTIGILQQPARQQIYQPQIYNEPVSLMNTSYIQQSQNLINFSGSNDVYQIANNQHDVSNRQPTITSYEVRFACPSCSQIFVSENLLQMHIKTAHNFICDICNLRFYNFNDFTLHKVKHNLI